MKKLLTIIILILLFSNSNTSALSIKSIDIKPYNDTTDEVIEKINPIFINSEFKGLDVILTIPNNINNETIILSPKIFNVLEDYSYIKKDTDIFINITIDNQTNNSYDYKNNSLINQPDDITRYGIKDNFIDTNNATGFDKKIIYDIYYPYRTLNSAIQSLCKYKCNYNDIDDIKLDSLLKDNNYSGIESLNKYYIDFYNNKYNLNNTKLEEFTSSVIKDIFSGQLTSIKDNNKEIIELAYNFFYNELLDFNISDGLLNDTFNTINSKEKKTVSNINLKIDEIYTPESFKYLNYSNYIEFRLQNSINSYITPPNTGIN